MSEGDESFWLDSKELSTTWLKVLKDSQKEYSPLVVLISCRLIELQIQYSLIEREKVLHEMKRGLIEMLKILKERECEKE